VQVQDDRQGGKGDPLEVTAEELWSLQEGDGTLEAVRKAASGEACLGGIGFFKRDGHLFRRWTPPVPGSEEIVVEQLVLPNQCRQTVLRLAHEIPLGGHMGKNKNCPEDFAALLLANPLQRCSRLLQVLSGMPEDTTSEGKTSTLDSPTYHE